MALEPMGESHTSSKFDKALNPRKADTTWSLTALFGEAAEVEGSCCCSSAITARAVSVVRARESSLSNSWGRKGGRVDA